MSAWIKCEESVIRLCFSLESRDLPITPQNTKREPTIFPGLSPQRFSKWRSKEGPRDEVAEKNKSCWTIEIVFFLVSVSILRFINSFFFQISLNLITIIPFSRIISNSCTLCGLILLGVNLGWSCKFKTSVSLRAILRKYLFNCHDSIYPLLSSRTEVSAVSSKRRPSWKSVAVKNLKRPTVHTYPSR